MVKLSVMYPSGEGKTFDMDYYLGTHVPLLQEKLGATLKGIAVEQGIASAAPGSPAPFMATGHFLFESVEAFQSAFAPHAQAIMGDLPNFTNCQPVIQIGEVKV